MFADVDVMATMFASSSEKAVRVLLGDICGQANSASCLGVILALALAGQRCRAELFLLPCEREQDSKQQQA